MCERRSFWVLERETPAAPLERNVRGGGEYAEYIIYMWPTLVVRI